ncbi:hypothetical protein FS837_005641 [Tulasnella sp. UAMH 9824]|nr:hypothetical protein FS837_005641 [Tulasnella sp. UAMH 9824]
MSILPFIGPQLEALILKMGEGNDYIAHSLLMQSLTHRTLTLKTLRLISPGPAHHISYPFAALISSSPNLTLLSIPPFSLTEEVVAAAGQLPLLKTLAFSAWWASDENYHESGMCFKFIPESFPQLRALSFGSLPNRMAEILQSTDHLRRLSAVVLDCPAYNSPQEIENVFAVLGSGAQQLERVMMACSPVPQLAGSSSNDSLSVDSIRPLFSCTQLKRFGLFAPHFAPPKDDDIVEMGKNWPGMWFLSLCPSPLLKRDVGVSFSILSSFAKSFPNLQELRLFFGQEVPEFDGDLYPAYRFTKLGTLKIGWPRIPKDKTRDIGFLLASLCQNPPLILPEEGVGNRGHRLSPQENEDLIAKCSDIKSNMDLAFRIKGSFDRKFNRAGPAVE